MSRSLPFRRDAWLPLAFPVGASRYWTDDERVRRTLSSCGAELDARDPELAVFSGPLTGRPSAPRAAVTLSARQSDTGSWPVRRATRLARGVALRAQAGRSSRRLLRLGFGEPMWISWEPEKTFRPPRPDRGNAWMPATAIPVNLELIADSAGSSEISAFEAATGAASAAVGHTVEVERVLVRDRSIIGFADESVLRVELGPAQAGIRQQSDALARLRALDPPQAVRSRTTQIEATGAHGLAVWSLERRFRGAPLSASTSFDGDLGEQGLEILAGFARTWSGPVSEQRIRDETNAVAPSCDRALSGELERICAWLTARVARLPGVLAHGDFFHGNLIVAGERIEGLVDWERLAVGRPALHDLVHLRIAADVAARGGYGPAACAWSEDPKSRRDPLLRAYGKRLGFTFEEADILAVAMACWLAHIAHELSRVADNAENRAWVLANVDRPLATFARLSAAAG